MKFHARSLIKLGHVFSGHRGYFEPSRLEVNGSIQMLDRAAEKKKIRAYNVAHTANNSGDKRNVSQLDLWMYSFAMLLAFLGYLNGAAFLDL